MNPVRLALVGFGRWGRNYIRAARDSGEAEVTVVVTSPEYVKTGDVALGGAHCVEHLGHALMPGVDAVVFAGNPAHAPIVAESVLRHGLPILIEKPAGLSILDAERIARFEQGSGTFALIGHQHLFAAGYEDFLELVCGDHEDVPIATWCGDGPIRDFPPLWDYGPHAVACIIRMIGPLRGNVCVTPIDTAEGSFRFSVGDGFGVRGGVMVSNRWTEKIATVEVMVGGARVSYDAFASQAEPPLTRQVRAFAQAVRAGGTDDGRFGARWAVDVAKVLTMAQFAADHPLPS